MGLALNELIAIKYLSKWDVQKMTSKAGYKVVLNPGEELLSILDNTRSERREQPLGLPELASEQAVRKASAEELEAIELLKKHGVVPAKALKLVAQHGVEVVSDTVEYLATQVSHGKRKTIDNPAGLIIYSIENALPVPATFVTSRKRKAVEEAQTQRHLHDKRAAEVQSKAMKDEMAYSKWIDEQQDRAVREMYSEEDLAHKITQLCRELSQRDERVRRMPETAKRDVAYRLLRKELAAGTQLPSLEDWQVTNEQTRLF